MPKLGVKLLIHFLPYGENFQLRRLHIPVQLQFLQLSIQLQQWQHNSGLNDQFAVSKVNKLVIKWTFNALPFMSFFFLGWFLRCSLKHLNANIRYLSSLTNLWMCFKKEEKIQTTYSINVKYKKNVSWNTVMKKWLQSEMWKQQLTLQSKQQMIYTPRALFWGIFSYTPYTAWIIDIIYR